ncbi:FmdB family transcriptional regulator [Ideonella sp. DXS29W]|uniref:FmdB family transcriptional regulator n=1 Tax=Ideonella lacteola TaxID=2984193 RepID=A0ABU9BIK9_9BURK
MSDFDVSAVGLKAPTYTYQPIETSAPAPSSDSGQNVYKQLFQLVQQLMQMLAPLFENDQGSSGSPSPSPSPSPSAAPSPSPCAAAPSPASTGQGGGAPAVSGASPAPAPRPAAGTEGTPAGSGARSVQEAAAHTNPTFKPVLRGDEAEKDAAIKTQEDFGRAVDQTAKEYGLDPNAFRAELQAESSAFTEGFQKAMQHEGDLDRRGENNTSIGLGQISRKFLDGREWSGDGPGNERLGGQVVSTEDYMKSPTIQMRMAAANIAQRIADKGGVEQGLAYYVSGDADPNNPKARAYIDKINKAMNDPAVVDVGRG